MKGRFRSLLLGLSWLCLVVGLALTGTGCGVTVRGVDRTLDAFRNSELFHQGRHGDLTDEELEWARIAWKYFENNMHGSSGLVGSVDKYPVATMWSAADGIAALIAAEHFGLVDRIGFDRKLSGLLHTLNTMPLAFDRLPNELYSTESRGMLNFDNERGQVGWSAVDIGRLLVWLHILRQRHPVYLEYVDKILLRWNFCDVVNERGYLMGSHLSEGEMELHQEGRLGYEEYAAFGYQIFGFNTEGASRLEPNYEVVVDDIVFPYDSRDPREVGGYAPIVTLPHALLGLEFNWDEAHDEDSSDTRHSDSTLAGLAQKVYTVQENRFFRERVWTARTDHESAAPPHFVHDAIFVAGAPWATLSDEGKLVKRAALVSTRAVFGLWALYKTYYTDQLIRVIDPLFDAQRGWYEGRMERSGGYDRTITSSTNAVVLESLLYKEQGKLFSTETDGSHYGYVMGEEFERPSNCLPRHPRGR